MFELRKDIPIPLMPKSIFDQMEIGDCLVFENEADYKAAAKSARAHSSGHFLCQDKKIWLLKRIQKTGLEERLLILLDCENGLTKGVIINRTRGFPPKDVVKTLKKLVDEKKITTKPTGSRFKGEQVMNYKTA